MMTCGGRAGFLILALCGSAPLLLHCGGSDAIQAGSGVTEVAGAAGETGGQGGAPSAHAGTGGKAPSSNAGSGAGEAGAPLTAGAHLRVTPKSAEFVGAIGAKVPASTFTVSNLGTDPTGALSIDLSGTGFTLSADQCSNAILPAGGSCTVGVGFYSGTAVANVSGRLQASADPGDASAVELSGSAVSAAHLTLAPAPNSNIAFGDVLVGEHRSQQFIVTNTGVQTSSALRVALTGVGFAVEAPGVGGCVFEQAALAGGASCVVTVSLAPVAHGPLLGGLAVSAGTGGAPEPLSLTGNGVVPVTLSVDVPSKDFGILEVGVASSTTTLKLSNDGDLPTGTIARTVSPELSVGAGCTSLAAHASCQLDITFKPAASGARSAVLTLSGTSGKALVVKATAEGRYRLTVVRPGAAAGRVTSTPAGIDCSAPNGPLCSALFADGPVQLGARTTNGSNAFFSGWSGGSCAGRAVDCAVAFGSPTTVGAAFSPLINNLIFVTHDKYVTTLGSATAYDAKCNLVATAAGLNNATANGYVALVSSPTSLARSRLGTARGWVRLDGRPFADAQTSLFGSQQVFNPIRFEETGQFTPYVALTGSLVSGQLGDSCSGWTSSAGTFSVADPGGGPYTWGGTALSGGGGLPCTSTAPLICMGTTMNAVVAPPVISGRKIWLSTTAFTIGAGGTPDQKCQAERPSGVTQAIAFISTTTQAASSLLSPATSYLRPDGTLVATGAQLATASDLESGIWQSAGGLYEIAAAWTGSTTPSALGTSTCGDWASTVAVGVVGAVVGPTNNFWWSNSTLPCNEAGRLYCLQTAP